MQGLVWFDFHLGMPHTLKCCFQAMNGTICINSPPHYVWHALEIFVLKCLTPPLSCSGNNSRQGKAWVCLVFIWGRPLPLNAVFKLWILPYVLTNHQYMEDMHCKWLFPKNNTIALPCKGHDSMQFKIWCGFRTILGCPIPWNAVFKLRMVPYVFTYHHIMYGMHCKCLWPNVQHLICLGQVMKVCHARFSVVCFPFGDAPYLGMLFSS